MWCWRRLGPAGWKVGNVAFAKTSREMVKIPYGIRSLRALGPKDDVFVFELSVRMLLVSICLVRRRVASASTTARIARWAISWRTLQAILGDDELTLRSGSNWGNVGRMNCMVNGEFVAQFVAMHGLGWKNIMTSY